ncbi:hypothetical protein [Azonexus sp. IMCC34839]|uniref:hypothetical protein n=1 Tax=Azonexus sp. IMCC34839 TaxID=3133695 RepID=UPI00399C2433
MSTQRFRQHGSFNLRNERGVFILDAEGPWNRETFDAYIDALKARAGVRPERWGAYCVVRGEGLIPPELIPLWRESNAMLAGLGLVAVAYHFVDRQYASFYEMVFREAIGEAPFEFAYVDGWDSACAWLGERGLVSG